MACNHTYVSEVCHLGLDGSCADMGVSEAFFSNTLLNRVREKDQERNFKKEREREGRERERERETDRDRKEQSTWQSRSL